MKDEAVGNRGREPRCSPSVEKALQELAQLAVTEACLCGACDICLNQTGSCDITGQPSESLQPSRRSEQKKNNKGGLP